MLPPETAQQPPGECRELATCGKILDRLIADLAISGLYGEDRTAKLLYLALTSRILSRPVSIAVKGPSSAGKSHTVESVLKFFPESAYYTLTGMSQKALAYLKEPLEHRFLVLFEAAGMGGGFATYCIRSLLSEGCLRYETVQKTRDDGWKSVRLEREGPTGLITTTTRVGLHPENETRLLSVTVNDSPEQTQAVMNAIAVASQNTVDLAPWLALQNWLQGCGGRVTVPFGRQLAKLTLPVAVRLRRDFTTIKNLIESHALLHRATRELDDDRAVVATVDDYAAIRELVTDLISEGVEASVPVTVRETVQTVEDLNPEHPDGVGLSALCEALQLDRSAVCRRVAQAEKDHYLINQEERPGRPSRLILGDPLPEDVQVLPQPEALMA